MISRYSRPQTFTRIFQDNPTIQKSVLLCCVLRFDVRRPPQVLFGTADGQVIVMDCHGRMLAHVLLHESDGIVSMSWNCPDFLVEDSTESDADSDDQFLPLGTNSYTHVTKMIAAAGGKLMFVLFFYPLKCGESSLC